jgi:transcription antitermination factor NusG
MGERMFFWYVLRSKPGKELLLSRQIEANGIEDFYPSLRVHPVNPRARKFLPYFPGYLFVHIDLEAVGVSFFQWMPYSLGLVCFDSQPATVPEPLLWAIRLRVEAINATGGEQWIDLKAGDAVTIQDGPFAGYEAVFDTRLSGTQRVVVLLKLLQAERVRLELPDAHIRRKRRQAK